MLPFAGDLLAVPSGCSLLMPTPDPNRAWVGLDTQPDADLAAVGVDGKSLDRTRATSVDPAPANYGALPVHVNPTTSAP